jgi:glycosyltransferase involved in cell wall biosynthesis
MKILYITQWLSPVGGGGEVVFRDIAYGMSQNGHSVHVLCHKLSYFEENHDPPFENDNLHVNRINPTVMGFPPSMKQNIRFIVNAILKGSQIIKKNKIELIHVNNFAPVIAGSVLSRLFDIPIVSTIHVVFGAASKDFWRGWSSQKNISPISSIIGPIFEKLTIRIPVNAIHAVSNATRKDILNVNSNSKVAVIYNGVDLSPYDGYESGLDYQNYVVFIGRLVFNKNLNVVISCFADVKKTIPDARLVVIGFGPMLEEWKKLVLQLGLEKNVIFTEYVSQKRKIEILSKSAALILPSLAEGMPIVILEAFALHKPVLLSDIEPHHDIVCDGIDGFLIPPYDMDKWAEKIIFILLNKRTCEEMGWRARYKVENHFNLDGTLREMSTLYTRCVAKKPLDTVGA